MSASSLVKSPCEPCLNLNCEECAMLFRGITTLEAFLESRGRDKPDYQNYPLTGLVEAVRFICGWGTGDVSNLQKLKVYFQGLFDTRRMVPENRALLAAVSERATATAAIARQLLGELQGVSNDAALGSKLRAKAVQLLESWYIMHSHILWLHHLSLTEPGNIALFVSTARDFPHPPGLDYF